MRLKDRVAIVTGAAQGIGQTIALGLAAEGAAVVIADLLDGLPVQKSIEEKGGKALALRVDVGDAKSVNEMVEKTVEHFGRVDILINNAAIFSTLTRNPFHLVTDKEWDDVMRVNIKGPFMCCKAVYPHMAKIGKGKIVNISSGTFWEGLGNRVHYITSKAGIIGLTRAIARDAGSDGIRVNAVAPGYTMTEIQKERASGNQEQIRSTIDARCLKRDEEPEDLLGAIIFLSCDESDFVTGQTLVLDGGRVMH